MRVLVVTPWFPTVRKPTSGIFVRREVEALTDHHDVRVLHLDWDDDPDDEAASGTVETIRYRFRRTNPPAFVRARRLVRAAAQTVDLVHTHALPGLLPWLAGRPSNRPWVHSEHWSGLTAPQTLTSPQRLVRRALLPALRRPEVVVAESERLREQIRTRRPGPTRLVPCVVDAVPVHENPRESGRIRLVGVGGLEPRKGALVALGATHRLREQGLDADLTWVGEGTQRAELQETARSLGMTGHLRLTGSLDAAGVGRELDAADLFVLPTLGDNFCIAVAEALMHGRPVLSGALTGASEYTDPRYGTFLADRDPAAFARAAVDLMDRTRSVTAAQIAESVRGQFSRDRVTELMGQVYETATATHRSP